MRTTTVPIDQLVRMSISPGTEPYFSFRKVYRFDDPDKVYGVTYAGLSVNVAFAETIIHKKGLFVDGEWVVSEADVLSRSVVTYAHPSKTELRVADLTGENLKALGFDNDICASDNYTEAMEVSSTLYELLPDLDGILYVSRQTNRGLAVAIFKRSGVDVSPISVLLPSHPDYNVLLSRYNVAVLPSGLPPKTIP